MPCEGNLNAGIIYMAVKLNYQADKYRKNGQIKKCVLSWFRVLIKSVWDTLPHLRNINTPLLLKCLVKLFLPKVEI